VSGTAPPESVPASPGGGGGNEESPPSSLGKPASASLIGTEESEPVLSYSPETLPTQALATTRRAAAKEALGNLVFMEKAGVDAKPLAIVDTS